MESLLIMKRSVRLKKISKHLRLKKENLDIKENKNVSNPRSKATRRFYTPEI